MPEVERGRRLGSKHGSVVARGGSCPGGQPSGRGTDEPLGIAWRWAVIGSNSTALKQHAYSVFAASRREGPSAQQVPQSVLRPTATGADALAQSMMSRRPIEAGGPSPARVAEPKPGRVTPAYDVAAAVSERGSSGASAGVDSEPSHAEIRDRAYALYLARQGQPGDPVADWLGAEAQLRRERGLG